MAAQQKRSKERLEAILEAALRCFRAEGFHGASISRICAEAGISPGHLYHYFDSKEAIVEAIVQSDRARIRGMLDELATASDLIDAIMQVMLTPSAGQQFKIDGVLSLEIYAEATRNPRVAAILNDFHDHARAAVAGLIKTFQHEGKVDRDAQPEVLAGILISIAEGLMMRETIEPAQRFAEMAPYLQRMLRVILLDATAKK
ncbi:MAG: TetR/AcrR family transcriptional regulator [Rhodobacter sp.]|jgi:TetR/AcrR family transcriptional repressor of uid operon|nr:TetR/AcrR family transcriptional regulator [Rhodobacter sp.]